MSELVKILEMPWISENMALIVGFVWFLWILTIVYVIKDFSNRSGSALLLLLSVIIVVVFTPILWLPIYWVMRPITIKSSWDLNYVDNESTIVICPHCKKWNDLSYDFCVFCGDHLRVQCKECNKDFPCNHAYCYHCWAPNLNV